MSFLVNPSPAELDAVASDLGFRFESDEQRAETLAIIQHTLEPLRDVACLPDYTEGLEPGYPRHDVRFPAREENPLNAWWIKCRIEGKKEGPLSGMTVAIKDSFAVASMPMSNGSFLLEGYTPTIDATVVRRVLDAGATIVGKANCEDLCYSGGSHSCAWGAVRNPHFPGANAGGSSSGCGALVGNGEVDLAIGSDQGGSIRLPGAWCGVCGMKPTWGLVPYTGGMSMAPTCDHAGPMTRDVTNNALLLQVLAGNDNGLDHRQHIPPHVSHAYHDRLMARLAGGASLAGVRIGVVREGFDQPGADLRVSEHVRGVVQKLRADGATAEEVCLPEHRLGHAVWLGIFLEETTQQMWTSSADKGMKGAHMPDLNTVFFNAKQTRGDAVSQTAKVSFLTGQILARRYGGSMHAKCANLARKIAKAYDAALARFDVLVMPTIPYTAPELPPRLPARCNLGALSQNIHSAFGQVLNTAVFNATGHPAMSVPCGTLRVKYGEADADMPVGFQIVGKHFDEDSIYFVAHAVERVCKPAASA